jgi:Na+-driven multidrug efflux pump
VLRNDLAGHSEAAETGKLMVSLGVGAGVMGGITTTALPLLLPQLLTSDPALHNVMRTVLPQVT